MTADKRDETQWGDRAEPCGQIGHPRDPIERGGEAACLLNLVYPECGAVMDSAPPPACGFTAWTRVRSLRADVRATDLSPTSRGGV